MVVAGVADEEYGRRETMDGCTDGSAAVTAADDSDTNEEMGVTVVVGVRIVVVVGVRVAVAAAAVVGADTGDILDGDILLAAVIQL